MKPCALHMENSGLSSFCEAEGRNLVLELSAEAKNCITEQGSLELSYPHVQPSGSQTHSAWILL